MLWKSSVIYMCVYIYIYILLLYISILGRHTESRHPLQALFGASSSNPCPSSWSCFTWLRGNWPRSHRPETVHGRKRPVEKGDECPILGHPWKQEVPEKKMKKYFCSSFAITKILLTCGIWRSKSIDKHQHAERLTLRWNSGVWVAPATRSGCSPFLRVL